MKNLIYIALFMLTITPLALADTKDEADPKCDKILAELKEAQAQHNKDHRAKGKAFYNWKKYYDQLHSDSYLGTDQPLMNSVEKCKSDDDADKDFCKGVSIKYDEISPKEQSAKKVLDEAKEKSNVSRRNYNLTLAEAADMGCVMKSR